MRAKILLLSFVLAALAASPAAAQKKGGTLRLYHNDNPPSTSLLEESTIASVMPFAAVFNNLVVFDPAQVSPPMSKRVCGVANVSARNRWAHLTGERPSSETARNR